MIKSYTAMSRRALLTDPLEEISQREDLWKKFWNGRDIGLAPKLPFPKTERDKYQYLLRYESNYEAATGELWDPVWVLS